MVKISTYTVITYTSKYSMSIIIIPDIIVLLHKYEAMEIYKT